MVLELPQFVCAVSAISSLKLSSNPLFLPQYEVETQQPNATKISCMKPGNGASFVRTMMKNYLSGNTVEKTFCAGSSIEKENTPKEIKEFIFKDSAQYVFMDMDTNEQVCLSESEVGNTKKWLKFGMDCNLLSSRMVRLMVIGLDLPDCVQLEVVEGDSGLSGGTAQGGSKPATLETGAVVNVPLFIDVGEIILGEHQNRAVHQSGKVGKLSLALDIMHDYDMR